MAIVATFAKRAMKINRLMLMVSVSTLITSYGLRPTFASEKPTNGLVILKTDDKTQFKKTSGERFELLEGTALIQPKQSVDIQLKDGLVKGGSWCSGSNVNERRSRLRHKPL